MRRRKLQPQPLDLILLVFLSLACYRVAGLIAFDEGPLRIFWRLRVVLGAYDYGPNGRPQSVAGRFIRCPYCVGAWVALGLAFVGGPLSWETLLWWGAIAGGQALLQSFEGGH